MNSLFRFERPYFLFLLFGVGLIILVILILEIRHKQKIKKIGDLIVVKKMISGSSKLLRRIKYLFLILAYISLVVALANPQLGSKVETIERKGVDLVLCLDISNSMLAEDLKPNRLERSKQAIYHLLDNLKNDRIGLVVFAGKAYMQLPLTNDYNSVKMILSNINTDYIQVQGTDLSGAIDESVKLFQENQTSKAIIIISDGEDHMGNALKSAQKAVEKGIFIYTIGVGLPEGGPIPETKNGKIVGFKKDKQGRTVVTKLEEKSLVDIATAGKGVYTRANASRMGLKKIFDQISTMETTVFDEQRITGYRNGFSLFIALTLIFISLYYLIPSRKSQRLSLDNLFKEKK